MHTLFTVTVSNDSSGPSFGNNTSDSDSNNSVVVITTVTVSVTSFVLLIIFCGVALIALLRSTRSLKDISADESHTQPSPYYENIILPRVTVVTYQDQEFELKDNIAYGPLSLSAGASH